MSDKTDPAPAVVPHVGTYRRLLPVSLERLYENALDWEHLPWLHSTSFCDIECIDAGEWGWLALAGVPPVEQRIQLKLELRLDRDCRRWITRTLDGPTRGAEIWTHAFEIGEKQTDIVVDFFVPGTPLEQVEAVGDFYKAVYQRLYDEDVSMMVERQRQLDSNADRNGATADSIPLGRFDEIRERLPLTVEQGGLRYRVAEIDGELLAYSVLCPHNLGPLENSDIINGIIECPWHGYKFDILSGQAVDGHRCRLATGPRVIVDPVTSEVVLEALSRR